MRATQQVCSSPGCPELVERGACRRHDASRRPTSSRNHRGIPRQARGYDRAYELDRKPLLGRPCELKLPGCLGLANSADHVIPVSQGGRGGPLRPACTACNSAAGAKLVRIA